MSLETKTVSCATWQRAKDAMSKVSPCQKDCEAFYGNEDDLQIPADTPGR